jgi:hypothetical protein
VRDETDKGGDHEGPAAALGDEDLAARKTGVKAGAVQASDQVLPYIEQRAAGATRGVSGRIGSLAVDPSDPS